MNQELLSLDLTRSVLSVDVPVVFFRGDMTVTWMRESQTAICLRAPVKRVVWFENSARMCPLKSPAYSMPASCTNCSQ
jgi:hypothetical protein